MESALVAVYTYTHMHDPHAYLSKRTAPPHSTANYTTRAARKTR